MESRRRAEAQNSRCAATITARYVWYGEIRIIFVSVSKLDYQLFPQSGRVYKIIYVQMEIAFARLVASRCLFYSEY